MKCNVNRFKSEAEAIALATKVIEETVATIDFEEDVKHLLAIQEENEEHTMILLCCLCFDKVNNQIELRKIKDNESVTDEKLYIKEFTCHNFRHTFATTCERKGVSARGKKALLGHEPDKNDVTERYTHFDFTDIQREAKKLTVEG